jgi:hypothetical protein
VLGVEGAVVGCRAGRCCLSIECGGSREKSSRRREGGLSSNLGGNAPRFCSLGDGLEVRSTVVVGKEGPVNPLGYRVGGLAAPWKRRQFVNWRRNKFAEAVKGCRPAVSASAEHPFIMRLTASWKEACGV